MNNKLLKKFASFSIGTWVGLIIGVISTPIITRLFSPEDFAKASMFTLAINLLMIFVTMGADQSYVRFFYEEEEFKRNLLLKNTLKVPLFLFILTLILLTLFPKQFSLYLFGDIYLDLILLLGLSIVIYVINRFAGLAIRMDQNGKAFSILQVCLKLFDLLGILLIVFLFGNSFKSLIYGKVLTVFLVGLIGIYLGRKHWRFFKSKNRTKHSLKEISKYGFPLMITLMVTWLFQSFDRFAIKEWGTMKDLGVYVAGFRIIAILNVIQTTFSTFWAPVTFEHYEKNPLDTAFYTKVNKMITIVMVGVAIGTIMFKDIIALLLGKDYRDATTIIPFLVLMPVMYTISETTVGGINFKKKVRWHLVISILSCLFNIIGNYILVPKFGSKGAAISTGLAYVLFFTLRTYFSKKYYKVNYNLKKTYFYILLITLYATYNTFIDNWRVSFLLGIFILIILAISELKFIKMEIKKLKEVKQ